MYCKLRTGHTLLFEVVMRSAAQVLFTTSLFREGREKPGAERYLK